MPSPTPRSSCRTRIIRSGVSSANIKPRSASGLFACVAMPSSPIPSVSPTKSFCYARAPALPPKVSDPKDFPRGSPECSRRWLPIMPDAASRVNCTAEACAAVGRASEPGAFLPLRGGPLPLPRWGSVRGQGISRDNSNLMLNHRRGRHLDCRNLLQAGIFRKRRFMPGARSGTWRQGPSGRGGLRRGGAGRLPRARAVADPSGLHGW